MKFRNYLMLANNIPAICYALSGLKYSTLHGTVVAFMHIQIKGVTSSVAAIWKCSQFIRQRSVMQVSIHVGTDYHQFAPLRLSHLSTARCIRYRSL